METRIHVAERAPECHLLAEFFNTLGYKQTLLSLVIDGDYCSRIRHSRPLRDLCAPAFEPKRWPATVFTLFAGLRRGAGGR